MGLKLKTSFPWRRRHPSRSSTKAKTQGSETECGITAHGSGSSDVPTSIAIEKASSPRAKAKVANQHNREKAKPSMEKQSRVQDSICLTYKKAISQKAISTPKLGILRLDYNYPPAVGDIGK